MAGFHLASDQVTLCFTNHTAHTDPSLAQCIRFVVHAYLHTLTNVAPHNAATTGHTVSYQWVLPCIDVACSMVGMLPLHGQRYCA
jgi:hypothetical protein